MHTELQFEKMEEGGLEVDVLRAAQCGRGCLMP